MKTLRIVLVALVALAAGLAASADAQTLLLTLDTPNPQVLAEFGGSLAVGDVNGDGKADVAVGADSESVGGNNAQGRAYVFSGADGSLLFTLDTPNPEYGARFGWSVAVGEVNGDGKGDIAVGAPYEDVGGDVQQGRAYVFSGVDGSLLFTLHTPNPQRDVHFGLSVAVGEVNGDGKADIAVGAHWEDVGANPFQGRAYVFSGANGSPLFTLDTPNPQSWADFGSSVAVGDVNGDGKGDIAVGAPAEDVGGNTDQGRAYVFSGADGSPLFTLDTPNPQAFLWFGWPLAVGDVDGDGKGDVAVGVDSEDVGGNDDQGRAYVFSGADGSLLLTLDTPNPQEDARFGWSVAVGEVNGDGKGDIAVGARGEDSQGRAYVFSGADGSLLFALDTPNPQTQGHFGSSVAVGDVNGNGKGDVAVGAPEEDVGGNSSQGRAYVFALAAAPDIAVTNVTPSQTVVAQGYPASIDVTVQNQGDLTETFNVTTYYNGTVPNGDFEKDPTGTSYNDISDWNYQTVVHIGNPATGDDLQIVDDYYFKGAKSVYSYLQTTSVPPFPGDSYVSQYLSTEEPVSTTADYITLWIGGDGYTTSSRYAWRIALILTDGTNTYEEILRCDCWGLNEGCTPDHYDYYDATETGADGNTWKRYTRSIPDSIDKSNLTIKIRHYQASWDLTQASSWYRLDSIYFSDPEGNPHGLIETKTVTNLPPASGTTVTFTWDTTGVALGDYIISAHAHPVPGETDTADNTYIDGIVTITAPPTPVGGIAQLPDASGSSGRSYIALAALAAALVALTAGGWYARRRLLR